MTLEIDTIPLHSVRIHKDTQSRVSMNEATIAEYAEAITSGTDFPPVVTFFDGKDFWLADGFHRYFAHKEAGAMEIASELREGSQRDAILFSVGANAAHGLRRTNEDKRRAVMTLLNDPEWATWSSEAIAKACAVSPRTVSAMRISANTEIGPVRTVERSGKTYEQNTSNIGKAKPAEPSSQASRALDHAPIEHDDDPDMAQLADDLQKENEAYQRQIKSLVTDDATAEVVRLNNHLDQLNGRLQGEITTRNEAQKMVKFYADLLAKIRSILGADSNKDIFKKLEGIQK